MNHHEALLEFTRITRKYHPFFKNRVYLYGEGDEERDALISHAMLLQNGNCPDCSAFCNIGIIAEGCFWICLNCNTVLSCTGMKYRKSKAEEEIFKKCLERRKYQK